MKIEKDPNKANFKSPVEKKKKKKEENQPQITKKSWLKIF